MTEEKHTCDVCGEGMPDAYDPTYCCNTYDCPCQGKPTNPPICSQECWDKMGNDG